MNEQISLFTPAEETRIVTEIRTKRLRPMSDITANYHGGNPNSIIANTKTDKVGDTAKIIAFMKANGPTYVKQIIAELGVKHQTASARLSDLRQQGVIERTGEVIDGCGVVRLVK